MPTRVCKGCLETKEYSEFYIDKRRNKPISKCKICFCKQTAVWAKDNPDKRRVIRNRWEQNNPQYLTAKHKRMYARHKERYLAHAVSRNNIKRSFMLEWLSEEDKFVMYEYYKLARLKTLITGYKWHVDHVVPLKGKTVCGLHVPWNLQVIPAKDNYLKSNSFKAL